MLFVVKPTSSCNGACVYCSAWHDDPGDRHRMSPAEVDRLFGRIGEWAARTRPRRVSVLWHGGEPLVMGKAFYRHVLEASAALEQRYGVRLRHQMQSNITLVDEEWADLLGVLLDGRRLGSSYDPVPGVRLLAGELGAGAAGEEAGQGPRPAGATGVGYDGRWLRGFRILKSAGVRVGVVCVVHRRHLGRAAELLEGFRALGYQGGLRMNPLYAAGLAARDERLHITPGEWGEFLWELWEAWNALGRPMRIDPLQSWERLARGRPTRLACAFSGHCTEGFTGVRADGAVFSCGRSMDGELEPFGNLYETPLEELLGSEPRRAFLNRAAWLQQHECAGCRWWAFCHGGCPNDAQLAFGDPLRATAWCEGRRRFLDRAFGKGPLAPPPEVREAGAEDGDYLFDVPEEDEGVLGGAPDGGDPRGGEPLPGEEPPP